MLWDLNEGKHLYTLNGGEVINTLVFSPNRYWPYAATGQSVKIWVSTLHVQNYSTSRLFTRSLSVLKGIVSLYKGRVLLFLKAFEINRKT